MPFASNFLNCSLRAVKGCVDCSFLFLEGRFVIKSSGSSESSKPKSSSSYVYGLFVPLVFDCLEVSAFVEPKPDGDDELEAVEGEEDLREVRGRLLRDDDEGEGLDAFEYGGVTE